MTRRPIPADEIIVTVNKIFDRVEEAAENRAIDHDALIYVLALSRADVERLLEIFGEKILNQKQTR